MANPYGAYPYAGGYGAYPQAGAPAYPPQVRSRPAIWRSGTHAAGGQMGDLLRLHRHFRLPEKARLHCLVPGLPRADLWLPYIPLLPHRRLARRTASRATAASRAMACMRSRAHLQVWAGGCLLLRGGREELGAPALDEPTACSTPRCSAAGGRKEARHVLPCLTLLLSRPAPPHPAGYAGGKQDAQGAQGGLGGQQAYGGAQSYGQYGQNYGQFYQQARSAEMA